MYKVLIVDDEVLVRVCLKSTLDWEKLGFVVVGEASNGLEAYEQYQICKPDIVITDIRMPKQDGLWLTKEIRKHDNRTKILILTCYDDFDYVREALKSGANNYILKSEVEDEELINSLNRLKEDLSVRVDAKEYLCNVAKHSEADLLILREKLYQDLISRDLTVDEDLIVRCRHLNFEIRDAKFALLSFFRDDPNRNGLSVKETDNVNTAVINLAMDIFKTAKIMFLIKANESNFEVILSSKNLQADTVKALMESVKNAADQYFNIELSVIYSKVFEKINKAHENYQKIESSLGELFYADGSRMIYADQKIETNNINIFSRKKELVQHILDYIDEENEEKCFEYLAEIEMFFRENKINLIQVKLFFSNIINTIFERYGYCLAESGDNYDYPYYHKKIMSTLKLTGIISLLQSFISAAVNRIREYRKNNTKDIIKKVINYIEKNYSRKISLSDLAAHVNLSKYYVCYLFKKETGITISNYVNNLRIERAKHLILNGDYSVKELYDKLGFRDQQYFSKTFKKIVGVTVTQYKHRFGK